MWEHQNEPFLRDFLHFSHFVASKLTFSYEFSYEPLNLLPQNRCFVGGFRQFSAHLTKCHVCHGICTLSPLDTALPMRFVKNTQHDASKVLRLPRKMTMDTSKVLRLPRKLQRIFWKRRKSFAPATQNDFRHVTKHVWMSRSATPATRNAKNIPLLENLPEARPYSNRADGCMWLRTVGQREPGLRIRERKGKEGNGMDRKGKEGKGMERTGKEQKERERKGKKGKERERKGKDGKGRERKGKDGKGREGRERKGEVDLEISRRRMTALRWACLAIAHCHSMFPRRAEITLLRVIPTMTFIRFVTGKSSGILSDISSGILSSISSGILSGISSGILPGISSAICSGISSGILSDISSNTLSGISSGILSGRWGPAVHTELGRSQVEVQRCTLSWEGPMLRSSGAHWAGKVPGWGPAVHTELVWSQVEVHRFTLSWEVGKELGEELARRKLRWKLMQTWSRRNWRRRQRRRRRRRRRRRTRTRRTASRGEQLW